MVNSDTHAVPGQGVRACLHMAYTPYWNAPERHMYDLYDKTCTTCLHILPGFAGSRNRVRAPFVVLSQDS